MPKEVDKSKYHHKHSHKSKDKDEIRNSNRKLERELAETIVTMKNQIKELHAMFKAARKESTEVVRVEEEEKQAASEITPMLLSDQLWTFRGRPFTLAGAENKNKVFYNTMAHGEDVVNVGDTVMFRSTTNPVRPYLGKITAMWKSEEDGVSSYQLKASWYYFVEDMNKNVLLPYPGGIFESSHEDENDIQTVGQKCRVISFAELQKLMEKYERRLTKLLKNGELYYIAGFYNPLNGKIKYQDGVPKNVRHYH